jgi:hypothetical protein
LRAVAKQDDRWRALAAQREHCHIGSEKQPPTVMHGPVNEAMRAAELKLLGGWRDIVDEWERTR